jgi:hypothetical protein
MHPYLLRYTYRGWCNLCTTIIQNLKKMKDAFWKW